jgi:hypothetical protein
LVCDLRNYHSVIAGRSSCHPAIRKPGVLAPYTAEFCDPIRELVEKEGIKLVEQRKDS